MVETQDASGVVKGFDCPAPDSVFLRQTAATEPSAEISEMAREAAAKYPNALERLHALMDEIQSRIAYQIGATHAHTTAAEALAEGRACARTTPM